MAASITLNHTPDGTPCVRLYLGRSPITGRAERPYREFPGMTDAEALRAAGEWRDAIAATYDRDAQRVGDMLRRHIGHKRAQGSSYNTIRTYTLYASRYAAPLARLAVSQVTPTTLDNLYRDLLEDGPKGGKPLSPNTVRKFREFLKGAFGQELRAGNIDTNPAANSRRIPATGTDALALDAADVATLQAQIDKILADAPDTKRGTMRRNAALGMLLALHTGARAGEVCALRWRDLNAPLGLLTISGNVVSRDGHAVRQERTKGKRTRNVSIDKATADALAQHRRWQSTYLDAIGRDTPICSPDGGYMTPDALGGQFRRWRDLLGLEPRATFHSLRHTHATMLLQGGTDMRTVSERLGHAQVSTTLETYAHVMPGRDRAAADAFGALLGQV